jgi:hypothetical protein
VKVGWKAATQKLVEGKANGEILNIVEILPVQVLVYLKSVTFENAIKRDMFVCYLIDSIAADHIDKPLKRILSVLFNPYS